jgi:acetone carboxylase gamma subunit
MTARPASADRAISPSVAVRGDGAGARNCCTACGGDLGPAEDAWKSHALQRDIPLHVAGGAAYDTGETGVFLRQFCCPACATLLDTETAMAGDPCLADRLAG